MTDDRIFIQWLYWHKGNPHISLNFQNLFEMVCKYYYTQLSEQTFMAEGLRQWNGRRTYDGKKAVLRQFAIDWQLAFADFNYTQNELIRWQSFFEEYGKKYGLTREFTENGII